MGDMAEMFRDLKAVKSQFKRETAEKNQPIVERLRGEGIPMSVLPGGFRFYVGGRVRFDFWPSTGKWAIVGTKKIFHNAEGFERRVMHEWNRRINALYRAHGFASGYTLAYNAILPAHRTDLRACYSEMLRGDRKWPLWAENAGLSRDQ